MARPPAAPQTQRPPPSLGWQGLDRAARFPPGPEAAAHMGDRLEPHALRRLGGERRTQPARAEEDEALVLREDRLVIVAARVDPEFQHAARTVEGPGNAALALQLADVAQVDEHDVVAAVQLQRLLDRQRLDLALRRRHERVDSGGDGLRHVPVRVWRASWQRPGSGQAAAALCGLAPRRTTYSARAETFAALNVGLEGERSPTKELKMTSNPLRTTLLAAALLAGTAGIALAQGSGSVSGGAVTESPQPGTGASGAEVLPPPAAPCAARRRPGAPAVLPPGQAPAAWAREPRPAAPPAHPRARQAGITRARPALPARAIRDANPSHRKPIHMIRPSPAVRSPLWLVLICAAASLGATPRHAAAPLGADAINNAQFTGGKKAKTGDAPLLVKVEVLLDRAGFSPGAIDNRDGDNFKKALKAFQKQNGLDAAASSMPRLSTS